MKDKIIFCLIIFGNRHEVHSYTAEYRNLMVLIKDKFYPDDFGDCGGQGRCGTCRVRVSKGELQLYQQSGNEPITLGRNAGFPGRFRLSCNIQIDKNLEGSCIEILES